MAKCVTKNQQVVWTETCVTPRHADVSRDFYFIFSERAAWGGELPDFLFILLSSSADQERGWPPCKVVFFGLATNTLKF